MGTKNIALATSIAMTLTATLAAPAHGQYELLLAGPVESVDYTANAVTVLGHRLSVRDVSAIALGHRVNVFGLIAVGGSVSPTIVQDTRVYAASGDQVLIVGKVNAIDQRTGRLIIDGAIVDYTAMLARPRFAVPAVGDSVRVLGTQPLVRGVVLAFEMAKAICSQIEQVEEASVQILSTIGKPIDEPQLISIQVVAAEALNQHTTQRIEEVARSCLNRIGELSQRLITGDLKVF